MAGGAQAGAGIGYALGTLGSELFGQHYDDDAARIIREMESGMGESALNQLDPETKRRMMLAIENLQKLGAEGGMDAQARAAMEQATQSAANQERMQRGAVMQNAYARGMGQGGVGLAGQLAAQQGGADRARAAGTQAAGDARSRALQAMIAGGNLAGSVRSQDIGAAQARDAVAQFNAAQRARKAAAEADIYAKKDEKEKDLYGGVGGLAGTVVGSLF